MYMYIKTDLRSIMCDICSKLYLHLKPLCTLKHVLTTLLVSAGTRETAFLYAVSSAGVVYTITRACSEGDLDTCHCDPSKQGQSRDLHGTFQWGGCSDNIRYALRFARSFMDAKDKQMKQRNRPDTRALMNLHNSRAGRRVSAL